MAGYKEETTHSGASEDPNGKSENVLHTHPVLVLRLPPPCFCPRAVTPTQTGRKANYQEWIYEARMLNLYLPRSGSRFSVAPLTHRQRKRLKTGREGQYTILYSMHINRYSEFQKVKISGVKYLAFQASLWHICRPCLYLAFTPLPSQLRFQYILLSEARARTHTYTHTPLLLSEAP